MTCNWKINCKFVTLFEEPPEQFQALPEDDVKLTLYFYLISNFFLLLS